MENIWVNAPPIIREFLLYHQTVLGHSQHTLDAYYRDLQNFTNWLFMTSAPRISCVSNDCPITLERIAAITETDIYKYLSWMNDVKRFSKTTQTRRLFAIRSLFRYLVMDTKKLETNPTLHIPIPAVEKSSPKYLSKSQTKRLLGASSGMYALRDETILLLFITCGLRISELARLNLDDIHKDNIRIAGKAGSERVLPFSEPIQKQMRCYLDMRYGLRNKVVKGHENAAFLSQRNTRLSVRRIQGMVDEKLRKAGLNAAVYSPHNLRHTAAVLMQQDGMDIDELKDFLGYEHLNTAKVYAKSLTSL